jgi:hypothetical protein
MQDKWKTLVRTAQIAPSQRRGVEVPEELLERVTRAQAFWRRQAQFDERYFSDYGPPPGNVHMVPGGLPYSQAMQVRPLHCPEFPGDLPGRGHWELGEAGGEASACMHMPLLRRRCLLAGFS